MELTDTSQRPSAHEYRDYRAFVRDMVTHLKATQRGFSYRNFARRAGFATSNFLKLVEQGKRNLTAKSVIKFARGLGLSDDERKVFEVLVQLGRAKRDHERNRCYERLAKVLAERQTAELVREQYEYYSLWYAAAVREMLLLPDFKEDPAWIAARLQPHIRPDEAARALELLARIGLVMRDADGKLRPVDVKLTTPPLLHSLAARAYHRAMLVNAGQALDQPMEKRNISSLMIPLTWSQYDEICRRVAEFRSESQQLVDEEADGESKEVFMLTFAVFPLTKSESP